MQSRVSNRRTHSDRGRSRPKVRCRASAADAQLKSTARKQTQLLDAYWRAKGIFSPEQRARLIEVGVSTSGEDSLRSVLQSFAQAAQSSRPRSTPSCPISAAQTVKMRARRLRSLKQRHLTKKCSGVARASSVRRYAPLDFCRHSRMRSLCRPRHWL